MIDQDVLLAHNLFSNKGAYALLLGSGVSRSARIPTGWELTLQLVKRLATIQEETCENPESWFRATFDREPEYSSLIRELAKTETERHLLLSQFFEPDDKDRSEGKKQPQAAHRAIARLVSSGFVRVIITTNFDRLVEQAIEAENITPTVLSTADAVNGSLPLVHQRCVILKVHGDYLDPRIKNTEEELSAYEPPVDRLLDQMFDEFGLIICGWSSECDIALRAAISRCRNYRFTSYWTTIGDLSGHAKALAQLRRAVSIRIDGADKFFTTLADRVQSLEASDSNHPISVASSIATAKRLLAKPEFRIQLADLARDETRNAFLTVQADLEELRRQQKDFNKCFPLFLDAIVNHTEIIRAIGACGGMWADINNVGPFLEIPQRLARNASAGQGGTRMAREFIEIPSMLVFYTIGISALANKNYSALGNLLAKLTIDRGDKKDLSYLLHLSWWKMQNNIGRIYGGKRLYYPASEWLFESCRDLVQWQIVEEDEYERMFDDFETIRAMVQKDLELNGNYQDAKSPQFCLPGRFVSKNFDRVDDSGDFDIFKHIGENYAMWAEFASIGLLAGDPANIELVIEAVRSGMKKEIDERHIW